MIMASVGTYADSDTCRWHLDQFNINTANTAVFHIPFLFHLSIKAEFEQKIKQALVDYDRVAILCSELHGSMVDFISKVQHPKLEYFLCGFVDGIDSQQWMDWFHTSAFFYKNNPQILDKLTPFVIKPNTFDILLGQTKPHRTHVFNYVTTNNLDDRVIMSYMRDFRKPIQQQEEQCWKWESEGLEIPPYEFNFTVTPVVYHGYRMSLSQVIPLTIYNQSAYSIIAETNFENHYTFFTEKTVKPILGRRLFIAFAGKNYLQNLRRLGFKTFDGIIDESYDRVDNNIQRWDLACQQMQYLFDTPQEIILDKIEHIVEHNYQVMMTTNWFNDYGNALKNFLSL